MLNSPKTSTSFSELQNTYDILMSEQHKCKNSPANSVIQQTTSQQKIPHLSHSPFATQLSFEPLKTQEISIDFESENQLQINSNIKPNESIILQHSANSALTTSSKLHHHGQQKQFTSQSSENSETSKIRDKIAKEEQRTENTQQKSFWINTQNQNHSKSSNQLRKSVQNQAILNAIDSMFRKKNSLQQEIKKENNGQWIKDHHQNMPSKEQQRIKEQRINQRIKQKVILAERLKNIHIFYRMKVSQEEDKRKNNDRVFIDMLHQNEKIHQLKISHLQRAINQEKRAKISLTKRQKIITKIESTTHLSIFERDNEIVKYDQLHQKITQAKLRIQQKTQHLNILAKDQQDLRQEVENNHKTQLKLKKWHKEVQNMVVKGQQRVQNFKKVLDRDYDNY